MISNHPPRALSFPDFTWATRPPATSAGQIIRVVDINNALFIANGTDWVPVGGECVLAHYSAAPLTLTGSVAQTVLATASIPGGLLGANGVLEILTRWSFTNNANAKTYQAYWGPVAGGTEVLSATGASITTVRQMTEIEAAGATNSQRGHSRFSIGGFTGSSAAVIAASRDSTVNQQITFCGTLANAGDSMSLDGYTIRLVRV